MNTMQVDYPEQCRVVEFGTSDSGRKMLAAVISDNVNVREKEPQFFYIQETRLSNTFWRIFN